VLELVASTENRRHQTPTQRAVSAYNYWKAMQMSGEPISQEMAAEVKMSNRKMLARARELEELAGTSITEELLNGKKIKITNPKTNMPNMVDSLITLINYFKNRKEDMVVSPELPVITDDEIQLANKKFEELQLECNWLVLEEIGRMIYNGRK